MRNILILYSTTDGHTLKICERIENKLNKSIKVNLKPIEDCSKGDLKYNDLIIIGASIRYGKHKPNVKEFFEHNLQILNNKKVAFFTVNVVARKPNKNTPETNPYLLKFLNTVSFNPDIIDVFAGKLNYPNYNFLDKHVIRLIMFITKGPTDISQSYEFTDWERVENFSHKILKLIN